MKSENEYKWKSSSVKKLATFAQKEKGRLLNSDFKRFDTGEFFTALFLMLQDFDSRESCGRNSSVDILRVVLDSEDANLRPRIERLIHELENMPDNRYDSKNLTTNLKSILP